MRLSEKELQAIKEAMEAEKNARVYKRYLSLYLYQSGKKCREIMEIIGFSKPTICSINQQYKQEGLAGIPDKPHTGRPPRLTEEQEADIKDMILKNVPKDVGFPAEFNWTAGLVSKYIKQKYGFNYSIRGITKMLKRMDLTYTRPTYVLAKADKQKQEQFVEDFKEVKKNCWMEKSSVSSSKTNL